MEIRGNLNKGEIKYEENNGKTKIGKLNMEIQNKGKPNKRKPNKGGTK